VNGWFVRNVADAAWERNEVFGAGCVFETEERPFSQVGINVAVLWPGQPNGMYHGEAAQEDFLVLHGECLLVVDGQERHLQAWDFVHCEPWTQHIFVGAGDGPCAILMVGARTGGVADDLLYTADPVASRHGACVEQETKEPREAYARFPRTEPAALPDVGLPWQ
jgi:uncharacterized cupin superfamily protein